MAGQGPTNLIALRDGKQRAEALITARYAEGLIDQDDLERRLEALQDAETLGALEALIVDIVEPGTSPSAVLVRRSSGSELDAASPSLALAQLEDIAPTRRLTAIFANLDQHGDWTPARTNQVVDVFAEASLDFRAAKLGPGETHIELTCVFGSTQLLVPPGLAVRVEANLILAEISRDPAVVEVPRAANDPVLVITGLALMASLEISERLLGETPREARKRKRRLRRKARRLRRHKRRQARRLRRRGGARALPPGS